MKKIPDSFSYFHFDLLQKNIKKCGLGITKMEEYQTNCDFLANG